MCDIIVFQCIQCVYAHCTEYFPVDVYVAYYVYMQFRSQYFCNIAILFTLALYSGSSQCGRASSPVYVHRLDIDRLCTQIGYWSLPLTRQWHLCTQIGCRLHLLTWQLCEFACTFGMIMLLQPNWNNNSTKAFHNLSSTPSGKQLRQLFNLRSH